jgi:hypothetical protein
MQAGSLSSDTSNDYCADTEKNLTHVEAVFAL